MPNFFGNPEKVDVLYAWKKRLMIKNITPHMKVCSRHFRSEDYILSSESAAKRYLKRDAVPTCNLPRTKNSDSFERRRDRLQKRNIRKQQTSEEHHHVETSHENAEKIPLDTPENVKCIENSHFGVNDEDAENLLPTNDQQPNISDETSISVHEKSSQCHIGVQVETNLLVPRFSTYIKTDRELSTATGIESLEILRTIVDIVTDSFGDKLTYHNVKMNIHDKVVMTFVKLKQNESYSFSASLFQCHSTKNCQRIFSEMIHILSVCLKVAIKWPSRECISKNLPKCFGGFEDVRVVLDCTEICTQRPKNLCCQLITYSSYKKSQTCKIMTGVTPAGIISYLSRVYGGRVSDKAILEQSNLTTLLERGDAIMVDRGFMIDDICISNGWKLYRPPFLHEKKQFSKADALLTSQIAKTRVHIERSNQRIKMFKIVGEIMPTNLIPLVEDIFTVTVNQTARFK